MRRMADDCVPAVQSVNIVRQPTLDLAMPDPPWASSPPWRTFGRIDVACALRVVSWNVGSCSDCQLMSDLHALSA